MILLISFTFNEPSSAVCDAINALAVIIVHVFLALFGVINGTEKKHYVN